MIFHIDWIQSKHIFIDAFKNTSQEGMFQGSLLKYISSTIWMLEFVIYLTLCEIFNTLKCIYKIHHVLEKLRLLILPIHLLWINCNILAVGSRTLLEG